jgi:Ca2+-binding RTX toxin-like protein
MTRRKRLLPVVLVLSLAALLATVPTGAGATHVQCQGRHVPHDPDLLGTDSADYLEGTAGSDVMHARDNPSGTVDYSYGRGGDDTMCGGGGYDVMDGMGGHDSMTGSGWDDTMAGGPGNDTIKGGPSNDDLFGEDGNDQLWDGFGADWLSGGDGSDTLYLCQNDGVAEAMISDNIERIYYVTC